MRPLAVTALIFALAAGPAAAQRGAPRGPVGGPNAGPPGGYADPSAIVSAVLALNSEATERGEREALRRAATKDAILFTPQPVNARRWLKGRGGPSRPQRRQVDSVTITCDGSYGLASGGDGRGGRYAMLWRREVQGRHAWLMTAQLPSLADSPPRTPDAGDVAEIRAAVADCAGPRGPGPGDRPGTQGKQPSDRGDLIPDPPVAEGAGQSADGALKWRWWRSGEAGWSLEVSALLGGAWQVLVKDAVVPQP